MQQVGPRDDRNRREIEWDDRFALGAALDELVAAELAEHLPGEYVRLLARLDLWAFDDDDVEW